MVFQATSNSDLPNSADIRCYLAGSTSITCDRFGSTGAVNIAWQTVAFTSGVSVQHLTPVCNIDGDINQDITNVTIGAVADINKTFLLFSHRSAGITFDANDPRTARLTSTTNVELRQSGYATCAAGGSDSALQVVEYSAASVTRGTTGVMTGTSLAVTGQSPVNPAKTLLLYSYRIAGSGTMATYLLSGEIDSATSLRFQRSSAAQQIDAIAWERIEFTDNSTVQSVTIAIPDGATVANLGISAVNLARAISLSGGQWTAGQAFGETNSTSAAVGASLGRHVLTSGTNLRVTRDSNSGDSTWHSFVIEFQP